MPAIHRVLIEEARLTYREGADSEARQLEIKRFEASAESLSDPLALRIEGELDGQPVGLDGEVTSIDTLLGGEPTRLDVRASQGARELALEGELRIAEDAYSLMDAVVSLDGNSLKGGIEYRAHGERGRIEGSFAFDTLDLRGADGGAESPVAESTSQAGDKVFSGEPLDLQALRSIDGEVTLKGNQLLASNLAVNEIDLALLMEGGLLRFTPRSLVVGGGRISGTGELDARGERATLNIKLDGEGLGLGKMLAETGVTDLITDAVTRMQIRLKGSGGSVAALLGSLSGRVLVDVGRGKVNNEHLNLSGADLISELLVALNPFAKKEPFTELECAVIHLPFKGGVSDYDKGIAVQTDKMIIVSSGKIDLGEERLDIGLAPKPRKDSADLGIGAGDLVSVAKLQGSFAKPELGLDAANTAKAGLKVYSAIATGGTSLLIGGLLDKAMADSDPCQTARGGAASGSSGAGATGKTAPKKSSGLKGLFGLD
ncbi:MAG: hypothetical protein B0D86_06940 [Candidatus Sedimenticola endophacoides]|nr:MAG: hypothetical protein B0D86_06940 [Candidatus Sedimenticola endophacoides]